MFCAFEGPPKIVRLYGRGRVASAERAGVRQAARPLSQRPCPGPTFDHRRGGLPDQRLVRIPGALDGVPRRPRPADPLGTAQERRRLLRNTARRATRAASTASRHSPVPPMTLLLDRTAGLFVPTTKRETSLGAPPGQGWDALVRACSLGVPSARDGPARTHVAAGGAGGELAATAGRGRVVLVAGEAGIGKSALVTRFTAGMRSAARVSGRSLRPAAHPAGARSAARHRPARPAAGWPRCWPPAGRASSSSRRSSTSSTQRPRRRWSWSRTRTGPTRRPWTCWCSSAAGSTGRRRC